MSNSPSFFAAADAYEADVANARLDGALGTHDARWLDWANALTRAVGLVQSLQSRYLRVVIASHGSDATLKAMGVIEAVVRHSIDLASEAQDNDAFATGMLILDLARALTPLDQARFHGRMLAEQGRILQNMGELESARELYAEVERLGRWTEDGELLARAHVGLGTLARMIGDDAEGRRRFGAVLAQPPSTEPMRELHRAARHGLATHDVTASESANKLAIAWETYAGQPENSSQRVESLIEVANLLRAVGQPRAALNAYLSALATPTIRRLRLTALSAGALVAAELGERAMLNQLALATERLVEHVGHLHETAAAERALAEAWLVVGENREAGRLKRRGLARTRGRVHDVEAELLAIGSIRASIQPPPLPESARHARDAFVDFDSQTLLIAARASPYW